RGFVPQHIPARAAPLEGHRTEARSRWESVTRGLTIQYGGSSPASAPATAAAHTPPPARARPRPARTPGGSGDSHGAPSAVPPWAASSHRGGRVSRRAGPGLLVGR